MSPVVPIATRCSSVSCSGPTPSIIAGPAIYFGSARCVCVCACVCCYPFYSGRQVCGRTGRGHTGGRPHRIFHPPSFCGACLNLSREKDSARFLSLVDREVEFCVLNALIVLLSPGIFYFYFIFLVRKNPVCRDRTHVPTGQSRLRGYL